MAGAGSGAIGCFCGYDWRAFGAAGLSGLWQPGFEPDPAATGRPAF